MDRVQIIHDFMKCLNSKKREEVLDLFTPSGVVHTPLRDTDTVQNYCHEVWSKLGHFKMTGGSMFQCIDKQDRMAASFSLTVEVPTGMVTIDYCMALFDFAPNSDKIECVTIVYDASEIKSSLLSGVLT